MTIPLIQSDFSHGELDRRLFAHVELEIYRKTAQSLLNCVVLPQGGARRRFGSLYIDTIGASSGQYKLDKFVYIEGTAYLLVFTHEELNIYKNDVLVATVVTPYAAADVSRIKMSQTFNQMVIVHPDYQPHQLVRGANDGSWTLTAITFKVFPAYDFLKNYNAITFTLTSVAYNASTTLTASAPIFTADYVGGLFEGLGAGTNFEEQEGVARITAFTDSTHVTVQIVSAFDGSFTSGVIGTQVFLAQPAWSNTLGWPQTVNFYEDRLWFGGSRSLPQTIFGSQTGDYYNFDIGTGQDDEAIQVTIATDEVNFIKGLISGENLQIFTGSGAFIPPQVDETPLTPDNMAIRRQPSNGISDVDPIILDNRTIYVARGGKRVLGFVVSSDNGVRYESPDLSIFSAHLIKNPIDVAIMEGSASDDANYLFFVNSDGSLTVYQSLAEQNISAWTPQETHGFFKAITSVEDDVYVIVERTINSVVVQYLERLTFEAFTDCAKQQTFGGLTTVITGLAHLNGEEVRVKADGFVLQNQTVSGGQITIERPSLEVEVGLNFDVELIPIPVNLILGNGPALYHKKRIVKIYVDYFESVGFFVDGTLVPYLAFGPEVFDPPIPRTGIYKHPNLAGWDERQSVQITQRDPLPMTIIGVGYAVGV